MVVRFIWERGKSRHLDASVRRETRDFMSRNSLGSPTFMFYPVIMMSTYTPDKTKHYPRSLLFLPLPFPPSSSISRCRNRNSSATRKCLAFLRRRKCSGSGSRIPLPLFRQGDASGRIPGMPIDIILRTSLLLIARPRPQLDRAYIARPERDLICSARVNRGDVVSHMRETCFC